MTTYRVQTPVQTIAAIVGSDIVLQAGPMLASFVGLPFINLRSYASQRGWVIEPLSDNIHPTWLELDGNAYEIVWTNNVISHIILHESGEDPKELSWSDLPECLREQL